MTTKTKTIAISLITLFGGSAFAAEAKTGYMQYNAAKQGDALALKVQIKGGYGAGSYKAGFNRSKEVKLAGLVPRGQVDTMRYSTDGSTGNVGYKDSGFGTGFLAAVAAKGRGLVLVDVKAGHFVQGKAPAERDLIPLDKLRRSAAVKAVASKAGLDPRTTEIEISDAHLSAAFKSSDLHTISFSASLRDASGKRTSTELSTTIDGNIAKGVDQLKVGSRIEAGVAHNFGWLLPPSMAEK